MCSSSKFAWANFLNVLKSYQCYSNYVYIIEVNTFFDSGGSV